MGGRGDGALSSCTSLLSSVPDGAGEGAWYPPSHESEEDEYLSLGLMRSQQ